MNRSSTETFSESCWVVENNILPELAWELLE